MAKCITIASACNLYWRKHHLTPDTIAVEPLGGWRGAQVNQSLKALQWLYYQEHQIPKEGASADRIRHVRNGGEQSVRTIVNSYFVDGYDPLTRTVYEFHGCLYHGCPRCYPVRDAKHYATPDRTVEELYQATLSKRMTLLRAGYTVLETVSTLRIPFFLASEAQEFSSFLNIHSWCVYSKIYGTLVSLSVISEGVYLILVFTILHSRRIFMQSGHSESSK